MSIALPHDAKAGPTKAEVRSVTLGKLDLGPDDHFAEVGSCTGAVTIEAARRAGRVTALERKADRLDVTEQNLAANEETITADIDLRNAEAPEGCQTTPTPSFSAAAGILRRCSITPSTPRSTGS
ncbi:MAG: hypothetical protein J07HN4v3_01315 [Halonotius sp. J07HN4]|nr:MAG: hypothetical protein J07HN4v3_01315 [Halonotius sp. J07HN4]